jgi:hypothetical protein
MRGKRPARAEVPDKNAAPFTSSRLRGEGELNSFSQFQDLR